MTTRTTKIHSQQLPSYSGGVVTNTKRSYDHVMMKVMGMATTLTHQAIQIIYPTNQENCASHTAMVNASMVSKTSGALMNNRRTVPSSPIMDE